jgi:hypothetical protein
VVSGDQQPIIVALISALGGVLVAVIGGLITIARRESNDRQPPAIPSIGERTAVLERRAEDTDEWKDLHDRRQDRGERRLDRIERYLTEDDPNWRR